MEQLNLDDLNIYPPENWDEKKLTGVEINNSVNATTEINLEQVKKLRDFCDSILKENKKEKKYYPTSLFSYITQQHVDAMHETINKVLQDYLGREPTDEDFKKCLTHSNNDNSFTLFYQSQQLGILTTQISEYSITVHFIPGNDKYIK